MDRKAELAISQETNNLLRRAINVASNGARVVSALMLAAMNPTVARAQENTPSLTINVSCVEAGTPAFASDNVIFPPRAQVTIIGENIGSPENRVNYVPVGEMGGSSVSAPEFVMWTKIQDLNLTGRRYTPGWTGVQDSRVVVYSEGYLNSIRKVDHPLVSPDGHIDFIRNGVNYRVTMGIGRFTTDREPTIDREIVSGVFSIDCPNLPNWANPPYKQ